MFYCGAPHCVAAAAALRVARAYWRRKVRASPKSIRPCEAFKYSARLVAEEYKACLIFATFAVGSALSKRAMAPETKGAAMLVPLKEAIARPGNVDTISVPGANRCTWIEP